jgi:hypothetical protein
MYRCFFVLILISTIPVVSLQTEFISVSMISTSLQPIPNRAPSEDGIFQQEECQPVRLFNAPFSGRKLGKGKPINRSEDDSY